MGASIKSALESIENSNTRICEHLECRGDAARRNSATNELLNRKWMTAITAKV